MTQKTLQPTSTGDIGALPHSDELEAIVIAYFLTNPYASNPSFAVTLDEECFYNPCHRQIYAIIAKLRLNNEPTDLPTVHNCIPVSQGQAELQEIVRKLGCQYVSESVVEHHSALLVELALRRKMVEACSSAMTNAADTAKSLDDTINNLRKDLLTIVDQTVVGSFMNGKQLLTACVELIKSQKFEKGTAGILTGFPQLDALTMGWHPGNMIVLAARPSVGKSALAISFALSAIQQGHQVGLFSLEMTSHENGARILSNLTGIPGGSLRNNEDLPQEAWSRMEDVLTNPMIPNFFIDDKAGLSSAEFTARARKMVSRNGVELIIVDYLQLMRFGNDRVGNREQEVAAISRNIKATAKQLNIPIIALSQLSRQAENEGGPHLRDLRESGAIEQDADIVMLMSRPSNMSSDRKIEVAKNRCGNTGEITLVMRAEVMRFKEMGGDPGQSLSFKV